MSTFLEENGREEYDALRSLVALSRNPTVLKEGLHGGDLENKGGSYDGVKYLVKKGLAISEEREVDGGIKMDYYTLTDKGINALEEILDSFI